MGCTRGKTFAHGIHSAAFQGKAPADLPAIDADGAESRSHRRSGDCRNILPWVVANRKPPPESVVWFGTRIPSDPFAASSNCTSLLSGWTRSTRDREFMLSCDNRAQRGYWEKSAPVEYKKMTRDVYFSPASIAALFAAGGLGSFGWSGLSARIRPVECLRRYRRAAIGANSRQYTEGPHACPVSSNALPKTHPEEISLSDAEEAVEATV